MNPHNCLIISPRETDYVLGVNSPLQMKAVLPSGNWLPYIEFYERQLLNTGDTDGCVLFTAQESFDAQIEQLIESGAITQKTIDWFDSLGYMDIGTDGKKHFHSSPRWLQILTGNGLNGNAIQDAWDVMRKYGVLPYKDLPVDPTLTPQEYINPSAITQAMKDKAIQFLAGIGGKNSIGYHWITQGTPNVPAMLEALKTSPLCIGVNVGDNWNNVTPTSPGTGANPGHCVMNYEIVGSDKWIYDHYLPNPKDLTPDYPVWYALQAIVFVTPPPPAPMPPAQPTQATTLTWLQALVAWVNGIVESITPQGRAKLGGATRSPHWESFKKEYALTHLPVCAVCGSSRVQLHHKQSFATHPELELSEKNCVWLCENTSANHHLQTGHLGSFRSLNEKIEQDIPIWRDKIRFRPTWDGKEWKYPNQ